jgi:hypothetical protein
MANVVDLAAARERRAGERDADASVGVFLPLDVASNMLTEHGWRVGDGHPDGCWTPSDGSGLYGLDEALQKALVAEYRP